MKKNVKLFYKMENIPVLIEIPILFVYLYSYSSINMLSHPFVRYKHFDENFIHVSEFLAISRLVDERSPT